jgi:cyanuric acid amidohydrolase
LRDLATASANPWPDKRLSIGIAHTREFLPEEIGRDAQIAETMNAVRLAMSDGGIVDPRDVHFVQIKCPLLTSEHVEAAAARGRKTVTAAAYSSMGHSRGASAIGVARALGEVGEDVGEAQVPRRGMFFPRSRRAFGRHRTDA